MALDVQNGHTPGNHLRITGKIKVKGSKKTTAASIQMKHGC